MGAWVVGGQQALLMVCASRAHRPFRLAAMPASSAHVCRAETAVTKLFLASTKLPLFADDSRAPMPWPGLQGLVSSCPHE